MTKLKSPLISLGARGTIGEALTFQRLRSTDIVRAKPLPAYRYTLAQAYQRWQYQDYAYLWTQLSEADKQTWKDYASRYHLTPISAYLRDRLTKRDDLAAWWRLDERTGASVFDSSPNSNTGTIIGASPIAGWIAGARLFDSLNDTILVGAHPSLEITDTVTLEAIIHPYSITQWDTIFRKRRFVAPVLIQYTLYLGNNLLYFGFHGPGAVYHSASMPITTTVRHHVAGRYDGANLDVFLDGVKGVSVPFVGSMYSTPATPLYIGSDRGIEHWFDGIIDNVLIYNRALSNTQILMHSERSYPQQ